jgi:16S rRNA (uracil1498-N3)-methyltransferase
MSKVRIYLTPKEIKSNIWLDDKNLIHKIRDVLRLRKGETIFVFDGEGREYLYGLVDIERRAVKIRRIKTTRVSDRPKSQIFLSFPIIKEDKLDFLLQKATELGVWRLLPFFSQRSSVSGKPSCARQDRWRRIIIEAARQSDRLWLPNIEEPKEFVEIIKEKADLKLAAHIEGNFLRKILTKEAKKILVIVGPEGDFSGEEIKRLKSEKFTFIKLSENILRTETAAIFLVGLINYLYYES